MKAAFIKRCSSFAVLFLVSILVLTNCQPPRQNVTPQPTILVTPTETFPPNLTPLASPLGSDENPLVLGIIVENLEFTDSSALKDLMETLSISTGYTIVSKEFATPGELLSDMEAGFVHAAWLMPLPYIRASNSNFARVALLINHFGVYEYGSQFLASADSGFIAYYNPVTSENLADASTALSQFADQRPCWVAPDSLSGYVVPAGLLAENGISVQPGAIIRDHAAVVRALYVHGICDFGATFALSGDPRTSPALQDLPDVMNRIIVIWRSDAIIPNMN
ncbi:MAG: PhnD/SsuA/transferrin family substrate-binding protein, partial [Anaerolineales bacterium]